MKLLTFLLIAVCFISANLLYAQGHIEFTGKPIFITTPSSNDTIISVKRDNDPLPGTAMALYWGLPLSRYTLYVPVMTSTDIYTDTIYKYGSANNPITFMNNVALSGNASLTIQSGCYSGSWGQCSDIRLKKNVKGIDNALNKVLNLKGITYQWRKDEFPSYNFEEGTKIGFVAQEVEEVLPELVKTESDGIKSVAYSNMIPVLVEAIKEQQKLIDSGKDKEALLNERINLLQTQLTEQQEEINAVATTIRELKEKDNSLNVSEYK